jgi:hypothetical protein
VISRKFHSCKRLLFASAISFLISNEGNCRPKISYSLSGGRFGDNLVSYCHARWLAFVYDLDFLPVKFKYCEQLPAYQRYSWLEETEIVRSKCVSIGKFGEDFASRVRDFGQDPEDVIYVLEYHPEHISEWEGDSTWNLWLGVDWNREDFISILREDLGCSKKDKSFDITKIPILCHFRTASGDDVYEQSARAFPLKHLRADYFARAILLARNILKSPSEVVVVTDSAAPNKTLRELAKNFPGESVALLPTLTTAATRHRSAVVADFHAMCTYPVLIATQSNLSSIAAKVGIQDLAIIAMSGKGAYPRFRCDRVHVSLRKGAIFPYSINFEKRI